jgi:hypothetical protein
MSYTVKWVPSGQSRAVRSPYSFSRPGEAGAFACAALDWQPADIWVEDALGNRIMSRAAIERLRRQDTARAPAG